MDKPPGSAPLTGEGPAEVGPVVRVYLGSAVLWLLVGSLLAFAASIKLHTPAFLSDWAWLTFGRVRPGHVFVSVYGWASLAGISVLLWLLARLGRAGLPFAPALLAGGVLWNVGVAGGLVAILAGATTGLEYLEAPPVWTLIPGAVFLVIMLVALVLVLGRREGRLHIAHWYLLGAVVWFPFVYLVAHGLLYVSGGGGIPQAIASWWFAHNLLGMWLTPVALAALLYVIPARLGRPLYSPALAHIGFWSLAVLYNWPGMHHLVGGPLPAWVVTVSIVGGVLMLVPVGAVALNLHLTMRGCWGRLRHDVPLRFLVLGGVSYTLVSLEGAAQALRSVSSLTHFTHVTVGHAHLGLYAFVSLTFFGAVYHLLGQGSAVHRPAPLLLETHFWTAALGVAVYWLSLTVGGLVQGLALQDAQVPFSAVITRTLPYLAARSGAAYLMLIGHAIFAWLVWHGWRVRRAVAALPVGATV